MMSLPELAGRKVLITGAAGCIGAWVVKLLRGGSPYLPARQFRSQSGITPVQHVYGIGGIPGK